MDGSHSTMADYQRKILLILLIVAATVAAGESTTQIKTAFVALNQKVLTSGENATEENPQLKAVLALDWGPKSNETTVSEVALNKGIREYLMGGDIAVNPEQAAAHTAGESTTAAPGKKPASRRKRGFQTDPKYAWDITQPIPYFFDPSLSASTITVIKQGIALWQNNTCINFVENQNGNNALRFFSGAGCYASIGRQGTPTQDVSIGVGCDNLGTVMHEINHAIGFFHTMSRPDRDNFISINYANVDTSEQYNFVKNAPGADNSFGVTYDYGSVMQYDQYAWAVNSNIPTMVATNKWEQNTMGQRTAAWSDYKQANLAYNCPAKCPGKTCLNGGIANSRDCTKCLCPRGFGGASCDSLATSDAPVCNGGTLTATAQPQTVVAAAGTNDWVAYPTATSCYWMINAPAGKNVVFTLTAAPASCVQNCVWQGVEINMGNFDAYGVTMCCPSAIGQAFTATGNLAIIRGYARSNLANFTFQYSYV